jgi:hypothetical protein
MCDNAKWFTTKLIFLIETNSTIPLEISYLINTISIDEILLAGDKKKASNLYKKNYENKSFKIHHTLREKKVEISIFRLKFLQHANT